MFAVENKKKRKRTLALPLAKDWPPTSGQKKTLVPYGSRPLKLPRLDESPYKELWMKIVSLALANYKSYKGCCQKMTKFRDVHRQLKKVVQVRWDCHYAPLCLKKAGRSFHTTWEGVTADFLKFGVELCWVPCGRRSPGREKLVWKTKMSNSGKYGKIGNVKRFYAEDTYLDEKITRFITMTDWKIYVKGFLDGGAHVHGPLELMDVDWRHRNGGVLSCIYERLILVAPKGISRFTVVPILDEMMSKAL